MHKDVNIAAALRSLGRQALWMAFGLTVFWLVLAYPVIITIGWGRWVFFVLLGWGAAALAYLHRRKQIRAADIGAPEYPGDR